MMQTLTIYKRIDADTVNEYDIEVRWASVYGNGALVYETKEETEGTLDYEDFSLTGSLRRP